MDILPDRGDDRRMTREVRSRRPRWNDRPAFRAKVALVAVNAKQARADSSHLFDVYPNQITSRRTKLLEGAAGVFGSDGAAPEPVIDVKTLHAKIGELTLLNDFLSEALGKSGLWRSAKR